MDRERKIFEDIIENQLETDTRLRTLETIEYNKFIFIAGIRAINGEALTGASVYTSAALPTALSVPTNIKGVIGTFWIAPLDTDVTISFAASPTTPTTNDQLYYWYGGVDTNRQPVTQFIMLPLGYDGKITILPSADVTAYLNLFGYWL